MSSNPEVRRTGRLASRVVLGATLSGALAGTLAAATAVVAVDRLIAERSDRRLTGAVDVLTGELNEGFEEGEWEPLAEIIDDENSELVTSGIRLGVFSGGHRIGGEAFVPAVAADSCVTRGGVGRRVRACGRSYRDWVLVAAAEEDDAGLLFIYLLAGFGALVTGAGSSALASRALTRWALRPLTQLTAAVGRLRPERSEPISLGAASDCEEVELIRAALAELLLRIHGLLSQAQRLAADAAHELRTPLTTICAELELLVEEAGTNEHERLLRVSRRARQLAELVERLLVLASPSEQLPDGETLALSEVVEDVFAELPGDARERTRLALDSEGIVRGDPALLRSMVANAIDNALKFSAPSPIDVHLYEAQTATGRPEVRFAVRDRGPGIPVALRERVFEPFFRARADASPGHGLGLTLIGHIARTHGGKAEFIDAEPDPNATGARLRVSLPAWHPRADPTDSP